MIAMAPLHSFRLSSSRYPHRQGSLRTEAILLHMESMGKLALSMNYVVTVAAGGWWIQKSYFWRSCLENKMNGTTSHYIWLLNIGLWDNMFAMLALLVRYHYNRTLETQFDAVRSWNRLLISPCAQLFSVFSPIRHLKEPQLPGEF